MHSPRLRYASVLMHRGAREKALALARKALDEADLALRDGNQSPRVPLEIAAAHALCGRPADALDSLERAYAAGLRDHRSLAIDPVFEPLRGDPRFAALRARMTASIAVMRERANVLQTLAPAVPDSYARRPAASGNEGR